MDAAAIMAAPAVNTEPGQPAKTPQSAGDFKAVLDRQVKGQTTETADTVTAVTQAADAPEAETQSALPEEAVVLPDAEGLKELLELLQELLAAAGSPQGIKGAEVTKTADSAGTAENIGQKGLAEMLAEVASVLGSVMTGGNDAVDGMAATADTTAGMAAYTGTTAVTDMAENAGKTGSPVSTAIPFGVPLAAETLAVLQSMVPMPADASPVNGELVSGGLNPKLQAEQEQKISTELNQKLAALVNRLTAGENVSRELGALIKDYGTAPVIKEMKKILAGLKGSGHETTEKLMDALTPAAAGRTPEFTVEKAVKTAGNLAETAQETAGQPQQVNKDQASPGQSASGHGTGETGNTVSLTTNGESANRTVTAQPAETVKTTGNSFARWTEDVLGKISEKAKLIIGHGQSEMQIQLKPEFLGKVNLQVTVENGQVTARIGVENLQVKEMVEGNLRQLQQNLDSQGIKVSNLTVDLSANRNFYHFNRQQDYGTGKAIRVRTASSGEGYGGLAADDRAAPIRWMDTNTTVDYIA